MKYVLYGNGGSGNHGCEAIVRGTESLINKPLIVSSVAKNEDDEYGLNQFAEVLDAKCDQYSKFQFLKSYFILKIKGDYTYLDVLPYLNTIKELSNQSNVALSVGGDNYCYSNQSFYGVLHKAYKNKGFKTVLWGCSVEPEVTKIEKVANDLKSYNLIVARESITYKALKDIGANVVIAPDPAFYMQPEICDINQEFYENDIVGINISPLIISNESSKGKTYENFKNLIDYILSSTNKNIALIPHVVWDNNDDREVMKMLLDDFNNNPRIIFIKDHKAPELKYIISKCQMFIGARTHATIASYSSMVPTLVVGYSVKARGIAKDLFGTSDNYVLPVQSLTDGNQLVNSFKWLEENQSNIRKHLEEFIPKYIEDGKFIKEYLENI